MQLAGQERGYAMAALLVALNVMAVMLIVAMPVWKTMVQREKEEELIFRGQQYAHAIAMFQRKYGNAFPPSLDVLVEQRFLRKKFKDPITNDDFVPLMQGQTTGIQPNQPGSSTPGGRVTNPPNSPPMPPGGSAGMGVVAQPTTGPRPGGPAQGPIIGVASKSTAKSIRLYNGRSHYNEWQFIAVQQTQAPGVGAPGVGAPGVAAPGRQPGRQPTAPGGRTGQPTPPPPQRRGPGR